MELQGLIDQLEEAEGMFKADEYNTAQVKETEWSGWTVACVFQALLAPYRVRASYQEEEALRHFEQAQREGTR
jgi:hypothetical protein